MSNSETGHAKCVSNFQALINFCAGYGATYNPSNANLQLTSISQLLTNGKAVLETVSTAKATLDHMINERKNRMKPLSKLCTRIINALYVCGASKEKLDDARGIISKIQGRRIKKKEDKPVADSNLPNQESSGKSSVSHCSIDNQLSNFGNLIQLLSTQPNYMPNEQELTIAGLSNYLGDLQFCHQSTRQNEVNLSNARIERDKLLYLSVNCIYEAATHIKKYIKSVFGSTSAQYNQIKKIRFALLPTTV